MKFIFWIFIILLSRTLEFKICSDIIPVGIEKWEDALGFNCANYEEENLCLYNFEVYF